MAFQHPLERLGELTQQLQDIADDYRRIARDTDKFMENSLYPALADYRRFTTEDNERAEDQGHIQHG